MLEECVVKENEEENCSQDNLRLDRTRSNTPRNVGAQGPTQHDQESRTVSLLRDQVRRLQERLEYIEDSRIFYDPNSTSSYERTYVPHQALITSSSRMPSREVEMLRNTRENMSINGNVCDCQYVRRGHD